ncbi:MAG: hypothetical protein GKR91_04895 [Pseudomonadales bacterium]|nr:hypothetical protein [Pseudomonadales bacterium]
MSEPFPIILVNKIIDRFSRPVIVTGSVLFLPLFLFVVVSGAIYPDTVEPWSSNPLEITGLLLMLAVLPAYLMMCFVALTRTNNATFKFHNSRVPDLDLSNSRYKYSGFWVVSVIAALAFGIFYNIGWFGLSFDLADPRFYVSVAIVLGQLLLWLFVGIVMCMGFIDGLSFHKLGKLVPINLYNLDELNGFGRAGLNTFLMLVGSLAIVTLQSIDQVFRLENYINAFVVVIPGILIFVPLPIWSIHRRIRAEKKKLIVAINEEIEKASKALSGEELREMNDLIHRREQILKLRNWPMDLTIVSRFALYVFIPPLAWTGAALMEMYLDRIV